MIDTHALNGPISRVMRQAAEAEFGNDVNLSVCGLCGTFTPLGPGNGAVVEEQPCAECNRIRLIAPAVAEWVDRVIAMHVARWHDGS